MSNFSSVENTSCIHHYELLCVKKGTPLHTRHTSEVVQLAHYCNLVDCPINKIILKFNKCNDCRCDDDDVTVIHSLHF